MARWLACVLLLATATAGGALETANAGVAIVHYDADLTLDIAGGRISGTVIVFTETRGMLEFFEDRAGVRYPGKACTQVLAAGRVGQELAMFTLLGESCGPRVLEDPTDVWLIAHELAHQWWGNGITCRDWNHFWLNEGMATFLAAAYEEHRYGRPAYVKEIEEARSRSERVREQLGDARFWKALRTYTGRHMGRSLTTPEFQRAMEEGSASDLREFFERSVYSAGTR